MLEFIEACFRVFNRKTLLFKVGIAALVISLVAGGTLAYAQFTTDDMYRIAVDEKGEMRLLDPNLKGKDSNELKKKEFLIELPSNLRVSELVNALEERLNALGGDISELEVLVGAIGANVTALEAFVVEPGGNTTGLEELRDQITSLESTITAFGGKITSLEGKVIELSTSISDLHGEISGVQDSLLTSINNLQDQIDTLEQQMNSDNNSNGSIATDYIPLEGLVFAERPYNGLTSPTNLEDISGYGNHGTYHNITDVQLSSGLWTKSASGSSKIVIGTQEEYNFTSGFSVAIWVKINGAGTNNFLISKRNPGLKSGWSFFNYNNSKFYLQGGDGVTWGSLSVSSSTYPDFGTWHFAVATFNGTGRIFVDSVADGTDTSDPIVGTTTSLWLLDDEYFSSPATCDIALPKLWNRALTSAEIQAIYQEEKGWFEP